jgi:hypothetical protein
VDQCLKKSICLSGGYYFYLKNVFSILFYIIFANFKMLDIILETVGHVLSVKGKYPNILEKVLYILFYFYFHFFLEGKGDGVPYGTVVTGILDMRPGKHDLHFLVCVELLPHAFVNIPDEKMHIGVYFIFIFIIHFIFIYVYILNYIYINTYSFLTI